MNEKVFSKVVLEFIKDEVVECMIENDNDVLVLLKDVNRDSVSPECINEHLHLHGYTGRFNYGNGNWMSIFKEGE
ncbi:hypothetical protein [Priestia megaterium]|uniref:hypothetical protein n=1 Tax=Priestia megaterium TaxID=1404 RepID=UPI000BF494F1|nr:hypothetical protein [Priestia megaterium]PFR88903.1 hypothetical protein COK39_25670 [Priestia megaterium]